MRARFVTDTATVNVNPVEVTGNVSVKSGSVTGKVGVKTTVVITEHNKLNNRDLPDQHPISAITGLELALATFVYEQASASDTWIITHNLGKHPSCTVADSSNNVFTPAIHYDSENQITITMNGATTGKAYLN